MNNRTILLVIHPNKVEAVTYASELAQAFTDSGFRVVSQFQKPIPHVLPLTKIEDVEIAIVLGGDGTILRAAQLIQGAGIPILGINMGNVGFLAEIEQPTIHEIVEKVSDRSYQGRPRLVLQYSVERQGKVVEEGWALNEVTIARSDAQMVELFVQIDGRPLSRWGCDGVIAATPTGSTAYAFSAGGPVVWPEVHAIVFLPLAAHALFSRPMVISPESTIAIDIESDRADISADGMRTSVLDRGDRITIKRENYSIELVHLDSGFFTDRLVAKFKLPIEGWRGE